MSTRPAHTALVLALLMIGFALSGCGMTPVYGNFADSGRNAGVAAALDSVSIDSIPDRSGQKLRNLLVDRFYKNGTPAPSAAGYRLKIGSVSESIYGLGIAKDATATRSQIRLTAPFTLTRAGDPEQKPLISRNVAAVSSFNTLASQYTTLVTEEDARDQAINDLSQQITTLLELYFSNPDAFTDSQPTAPDKDAKPLRDPYRDIGDY